MEYGEQVLRHKPTSFCSARVLTFMVKDGLTYGSKLTQITWWAW